MTIARVIVAEDEPALLKLFARHLRREGYEVSTVVDGQECIDKITEGGYDLLLCDINMPRKDGLEVLSAAKIRDLDLEVILITGGATIERAIEAVRGGAADFLCKPIDDFDALSRLVRRTIERRHLRRENQILIRELRDLNGTLESKVREQTEELRKAYQDLKGLDKLKDEFLSLVSHELRTPVNGIAGFTELLAENVITEESERIAALRAVRQQTRRLEQIIKDVEWFLQLTAGKIAPEKHAVDVAALITRVTSRWQPRIRAKNLSLSVIACDSTAVWTDGELLENSLDRLLENAVKFTEHGTITLRMLSQDAEVAIEVQDTGCGIGQEYQERVLSPLTVADDITHHQEGRGLGLPIVRRQMELLSGRVEFTSPGKGRGSTFRLMLPYK